MAVLLNSAAFESKAVPRHTALPPTIMLRRIIPACCRVTSQGTVKGLRERILQSRQTILMGLRLIIFN